MIWRPMVAQKLPLVCYKADSDEIVGANMLFVLTKEDDFLEQIYKRVNFKSFQYNILSSIFNELSLFQFKSQVTKDIFDLMMILYENFNVFENYGVDKYLTSFGLSVGRKYRGRAIGDHFLATRCA